jgi:hypothetical protein
MAPDGIRGRVISYFTALRFGMDALGGLAAGSLAGILGAQPTLGLEAALVMAGALAVLAVSGRVRRAAAEA